jgi:uncharacterized protein YqgV (UPF0045/DUF77 family)
MAGSQRTFEAILNRFREGYNLISTWLDYSPNKTLIKKATLGVFIPSVEAANTLATNTEVALGNMRTSRHRLVFKVTEPTPNPLCAEARIGRIATYIEGDLDDGAQATKKVKSILKKMQPRYDKKAEGAPRGAGQSPSEKSFASAVGHLQEVIDIVTVLGVAYTPADVNLKVPALTTLMTDIKNANKAVTEAADAYGKANRARKKLYTGPDGISTQTVAVKGYLTSFDGGKKSDHYIEYNQAIKGT